MSTAAAASWTFAIVLLLLGLLAVGLCRVAGRASRQEDVWAVAHDDDEYDVGPDSLRLLQDTDAYLDEYVLADAEMAAGFDRLRQAIRDEQQKGEL